ncbi:MAG: tetratricopeptide repeat protein, partial [Marinicellaceae bacterium]
IVFISFVFSWQLNRHNQQLTTERDKAITVKNLMTDVFNSADPSYAIGKELSATEVLDMGLQQVRSRFKEHSEIEADLLQEIAITYQNLGNYHKSQEILKEVYAIRLALFPNDAYEKAKGLLLLGENATLMSENKQAKEWLLESLEIFEKDQLNYSADIISAKSKLGSVMVLLGEIKQAEIMLDSATELTLSLYGNQSFEYAQALNDLSSVYFRQGQYQQVQDLLIKTKGIREKILASKKASLFDKDYATNINNLGLAYYLQGDLPMGEKYFKQAHSLRAEIYTKAHPEQAQSLTNLGLLLNDAGRPEEAFTYLEKALKVRQATLVPGHMRINDAWNNLAMVHHEIGDFIQAEEIYAKLMQTIIEAKGEKHPQSLSIMTNRGNTLLELLSFQQAHDLFHRSLKIRLETLPSDHLYLSYNYVGLGRAKIALTDVEEGINLIEKAIKIRKEKLPPDHWLLGESLYALAMANFVQGSQDFDATNTACGILKNTKGNENHLTKKCLKLLQKIKDTPL